MSLIKYINRIVAAIALHYSLCHQLLPNVFNTIHIITVEDVARVLNQHLDLVIVL